MTRKNQDLSKGIRRSQKESKGVKMTENWFKDQVKEDGSKVPKWL